MSPRDAVSGTAQHAFSAAIRDPAASVPPGIRASRARPQAPADKRFAVYRNNVVVSLVDALASRFPASQALVGEAFFRAMARAFVLQAPPRSRIMTTYGDALPDFIRGFAPAAALPYLADVAALEASLAHAYHAADAEPVGLEALAALAPDALGAVRLTLHPSVRLVASPFPIVTIREQNVGGAEADDTIDMTQGESALVVRPQFDVAIHCLPPGADRFASALGDGETLGTAAERAASEPGFDLGRTLAALFTAGAIADIPDQKTAERADAGRTTTP
ncbi:MAG: DNA-binding domain-containing protein [Pseudomonadota bacterium]